MIVFNCPSCNKEVDADSSAIECQFCGETLDQYIMYNSFMRKDDECDSMIKRYVVFEAMTGDSKFFDTIEEAEEWLVETWEQGATELEVEGGFIAEVLYHGRTKNILVKYESDGE